MPDRMHWLREISRLDPAVDYERIYRITGQHEFPWDFNQALSFALFRTYAVPSIGRLLDRTGELTERTQKRYDDTVLILDAPYENGLDSAPGRAGIRRMNQMHGRYPISQDDLRYVLCTFVVCPIRWIDDYGWRRLTESEKVASANYYRHLGRLMGIKAIPVTWQEFSEAMDAYERRHFTYDEGARRVADSTLELFSTFEYNRLAPRSVAIRFAKAVMDDPLLDAFGYRRPSAAERAVVRRALRGRAAFVGRKRPRMSPMLAGQSANVRSYPGGFRVEDLGTFSPAAACPVPHAAGG